MAGQLQVLTFPLLLTPWINGGLSKFALPSIDPGSLHGGAYRAISGDESAVEYGPGQLLELGFHLDDVD